MEYQPDSWDWEPRFLWQLLHSFSTSRSLHVWHQVSGGKPLPSCQYPRWSNQRIQLILDQSLSHLCCHGTWAIHSQIIHLPCNPPTQPQAVFADQFAFRQTGSTAAAIVALLHTVCTMLSVNPCARVFVLDFSKAFYGESCWASHARSDLQLDRRFSLQSLALY